MALVNNATGVYSTLGFNYNDPNNNIVELSANTQSSMNSVPPVITSWQAQDIANADVGGYTYNPVSNSVHWISDTANTLFGYSPIVGGSGAISTLINKIQANCAYLSIGNETYSQNALTFLYHTDRLSNIRSQTDDATAHINGTDLPYYQIAIQAAKSATYIVNQTDGIANNSVMLGCFTSILEANQINQLAKTLDTNSKTLINSLTLIPHGEGLGSDYYTSNISLSTASTIANNFANVVTIMTQRETADKAFYVNLKNLITNYNTTKQYTNLGDSQSLLLNNFIGTPKLKSRINS
jgi:hypothetical protein